MNEGLTDGAALGKFEGLADGAALEGLAVGAAVVGMSDGTLDGSREG